jgi:hypothetical protein
MSTNLQQQQSQLLSALLLSNSSFAPDLIAGGAHSIWAHGPKNLENPTNSASHRGWQAYRAHASALAVRSLASAYPGIAQLLGDEVFGHLARSLWRAHPPSFGDIALWGEALAEHIQRSDNWRELLADYPALADMARVEWALHRCATLVNASPDVSSWSLLANHDPGQLRMQLAPGCQIIRSSHELASLMHEAQLQPTAPTADADPRHILIWRHGFKPCWRAASAAEAAFVHTALGPLSLNKALERTSLAHADFDFQSWLMHAAHSGLLIAIHPL